MESNFPKTQKSPKPRKSPKSPKLQDSDDSDVQFCDSEFAGVIIPDSEEQFEPVPETPPNNLQFVDSEFSGLIVPDSEEDFDTVPETQEMAGDGGKVEDLPKSAHSSPDSLVDLEKWPAEWSLRKTNYYLRSLPTWETNIMVPKIEKEGKRQKDQFFSNEAAEASDSSGEREVNKRKIMIRISLEEENRKRRKNLEYNGKKEVKKKEVKK